MKQKEDFHASLYIVVYKLTFGLIELISGLGIALLRKQIMSEYMFLVSRELSEDPHDLLARISQSLEPHLFTHNNYIVFTLILLGLVKIAGAVGLVYKQNWGVDLLVGLTLIMFPFQLVNLFIHRSLFDLLYILLGLVIALYLIQFKPKAWISMVLLKIQSGMI